MSPWHAHFGHHLLEAPSPSADMEKPCHDCMYWAACTVLFHVDQIWKMESPIPVFHVGVAVLRYPTHTSPAWTHPGALRSSSGMWLWKLPRAPTWCRQANPGQGLKSYPNRSKMNTICDLRQHIHGLIQHVCEKLAWWHHSSIFCLLVIIIVWFEVLLRLLKPVHFWSPK